MMFRRNAKNATKGETARVVELHRWLSSAVLLGVLVMIPYSIFLSFRLPVRFNAHNWDVAWVGFDSALIVVLAATAWAAWNRRQILAATSIVAGTMLVCDAWFDVTTSLGTRDQWASILSGIFLNVPLALFFFSLARRIMLRSAAVLAVALRSGTAPQRAHEVAMPFATTWHEQVVDPTTINDIPHGSPEGSDYTDPTDQSAAGRGES